MRDQDEALWQRLRDAPVALPNGEGMRRLAAFVAEIAPVPELARLHHRVAQVRVGKFLAGVFEGSPYLTALIEREPARLQGILEDSPEETFKRLLEALAVEMRAAADAAAAKRVLRVFKNGVALLTALTDLGGVWPVMTVTRVLTEAADAAVAHAVRFLFARASAAGQWNVADTEKPEGNSGYFVLAMGKMGAFELNYSSDIDLIVFYDRQSSRLAGDLDLQPFFVRMTRDLVQLLEDRTADGYVFRTDLRLRPDAGATQIALSTAAAHGYYETVGQNWERSAFIKARVCAGDLDTGRQFLEELAPFIWRKYLDYAAIADVHAMKRQIHAHKGIGDISVLGQNVKLGRGGIREIEFFVQTQQLIAGGRQSDLRVNSTIAALAALQKRGWVAPQVAHEMAQAYTFLRRLEHRLQMISDAQTHDMPDSDEELQRLAHFSGYTSVEGFSHDVKTTLQTVERHYAGLFEGAQELTTAGKNMVFAGATDDPGTLAELQRLGYSQPAQVLAIVRSWHHGRTPAVRSARARERLTEVQPLLIATLADTVDPDTAIAAFDRFLSQLPAGVQLFSLLKANPALLRLIADIMGSSPRLARVLSQRRRLLDAVLDPRALASATSGDEFGRMLEAEFAQSRRAAAGDAMQDILDRARVLGGEQSFLIGVRVLTGSLPPDGAGAAFALAAERMVAALLEEIMRELEREHGRVPGGEAAVVAMGKMGGREMTASSDLDLILLYDFADGAVQSDGARPLAPSHYYARLTQRLVTALSAPTAEGTLYDVDLRLRPSGQKGPMATSLKSFVSYQESEAWTWEHMAMTRARVIAGAPRLQERAASAIREILVRPRAREKIAADVLDMRTRIAAEKGTQSIWDLKQVRGGLVDLEFIAQYLQLVSAAQHSDVLDQNTLGALNKLAGAQVLDAAEAARLVEGGRLLHALTQVLRLSLDQPFHPEKAPEGLKALLARAGGLSDFSALETRLRAVLNGVSGAFERLIR